MTCGGWCGTSWPQHSPAWHRTTLHTVQPTATILFIASSLSESLLLSSISLRSSCLHHVRVESAVGHF